MAETRWAEDWPFEIEPLSSLMAAEVRGFDASQPIDDLARDSILEALGRYKILVLCEQDLEPVAQAAFTKRFGELEPHVNREFRGSAIPEVHPVDNLDDNGEPALGRNIGNYSWHTDKSYMPRPSLATMLFAVTLPPEGGDTEFADMQAAYEALPDDRKAALAELRIVHSWERSRQKNGSRHATAQEILDAPPVVHPLIRSHPMTGVKGLYIGNHTSHVAGWSIDEGEALLRELQDYATQKQFIYRHRWRPGDMVIWDNCALLHRAVANYDIETYVRVLNRTVVRGSVPI